MPMMKIDPSSAADSWTWTPPAGVPRGIAVSRRPRQDYTIQPVPVASHGRLYARRLGDLGFCAGGFDVDTGQACEGEDKMNVVQNPTMVPTYRVTGQANNPSSGQPSWWEKLLGTAVGTASQIALNKNQAVIYKTTPEGTTVFQSPYPQSVLGVPGSTASTFAAMTPMLLLAGGAVLLIVMMSNRR